MSTREEELDLNLEREGEDGEDEEIQTEEEGLSFFSRINWALVFSLISLVGVVVLWVAMPTDRSQDVDWLMENAVAQGDSLKAVADTVAVHEGRLDRHWNRMNDIENTMAVAAKVDSMINIVHADISKIQKVAGRVKKAEAEAKQSLDISKLNREELDLLRKTFGDHVSLKAKDAHGNQKVASSNSSPKNKNNNDWWDFVSQGKGGSK